MKNFSMFALAVAGVFAMLIPSVRADEWNKKTTFTFSGPVEVPGQVLSAGTYVFKLADTKSDRNIVQVFNKDENKIYGTFLTIPDYRLTPTGKTVIMFEEREAGSPQAVKAWFYPGDLYGNEFVYPKVRATSLAKATQQNVPSMPEAMTPNTKTTATTVQSPEVQSMEHTPLTAQKPSGEESQVAQAFQTTPTTQVASNTRPASELPKTASPVPLIGILGLLALAGGVSLLAVVRSNQ